MNTRTRFLPLLAGLFLAAPAPGHAQEADSRSAAEHVPAPITDAPVDAKPAEHPPAESDSKVERATRAVEEVVEKTGTAVKTVVKKTTAGAKAVAGKTGKVIRETGEKIESVGSSK